MSSRAAITVHRSGDEVRRLWQTAGYRPEYIHSAGAAVSFREAPGDRGTEIHVDLAQGTLGGKLADAIQRVVGTPALAKVKDDLRRFKQLVETGEIARSEGTPQGERVARKLKQRPAQPLPESEVEKVGA